MYVEKCAVVASIGRPLRAVIDRPPQDETALFYCMMFFNFAFMLYIIQLLNIAVGARPAIARLIPPQVQIGAVPTALRVSVYLQIHNKRLGLSVSPQRVDKLPSDSR